MNKEIEELLNELKEVTNSKKSSSTYCITNKHWQLLLSYIEQLKKRNKELYEGFMATQEELTDYATENEQLEKENKELKDRNEINIDRNIEAYKIVEQLENNRDKAIRTLETLKGSARWERHLHEVDYILDILKGDSDE